MTEAQWLACRGAEPMLRWVRDTASDRELRLFACACVRHCWEGLGDQRCRAAVEVAERFALGEANAADLVSARVTAEEGLAALRAAVREAGKGHAAAQGREAQAAAGVEARKANEHRWLSETATACASAMVGYHVASAAASLVKSELTADWLRDILGNPFRPARLDGAWQTPDVLGLVEMIALERAYDQLPILGDALEDAGCADAQVLGHCRGPGPHALGCWVVGLLSSVG
jgi:hypothetical protein